MAVALADFQFAVGAVRKRSGLQLAGPGAEAHGAAHLVDTQEFPQLVDNPVGRLRIELRAVGLFEIGDIAGVFDGRALHAQAYPEEWDLMLAGIANRVHDPWDAALAKSAGSENAVELAQTRRRGFQGINLFGFDPFEDGFVIVRQPAVEQSFPKALVSILELHVFADDGDARFSRRGMPMVNQIDPRL